jgi:hypothetical protein
MGWHRLQRIVCTSWALYATNRVIIIVAGPDDTDNIAPMPAHGGACEVENIAGEVEVLKGVMEEGLGGRREHAQPSVLAMLWICRRRGRLSGRVSLVYLCDPVQGVLK